MPHVLLVEDEPAIADTLIYALQTEHFSVTHCLTGHEAIATYSPSNHSLIILDIGLPDLSGLDVCRHIRQHGSTPILFLTARNSETDRILGLELGGDDYVTKPFSPREIVARVRAILRRTQSTPAPLPNVHASTWSHDASSMRILLHGTPLDLTAHEYKILCILMNAPGRVFSRDQLLTHAWVDPGSVTDRTIDAHIKSLRSKIRTCSPGAEAHIETRRGLGYSFCQSTPH